MTSLDESCGIGFVRFWSVAEGVAPVRKGKASDPDPADAIICPIHLQVGLNACVKMTGPLDSHAQHEWGDT